LNYSTDGRNYKGLQAANRKEISKKNLAYSGKGRGSTETRATLFTQEWQGARYKK